MTEQQNMAECFLCQRPFPFGPRRYYGRPIEAWNIMVCDICYGANEGGIVPGTYPHLVAHLESRGVAITPNVRGWIDWPK